MKQMARPGVGAALRAVLGCLLLLAFASRARAQRAGCDKASFGTAPHSYPLSSTPYSLVVADFDRDGSLDVAAAVSSPPSSVALRLGKPNGPVGAPPSDCLAVFGYAPSLA